MVICLQRGADLHMAQLMPLALTVSCFSKIQIGFTFLVPAHLGSPGKGPLDARVCVGVLYLLQCSVRSVCACTLAQSNSGECIYTEAESVEVHFSSKLSCYNTFVLQ